MSMSRKDYEKIAEVFSLHRLDDGAEWPTIDQLAERLADVFADDNPNFKPEKFLAACGNVVKGGG